MELDELLDGVPGWGGRARTVVPLKGGITNRNYRVTVDGEHFVMRVPGEHTALLGINRHHERAAAEQAARLGIAPAVKAFVESTGVLVTRFVAGGSPGAEALGRPPLLGEVAALLRIVHEAPAIAAPFDWYRVPPMYAAVAVEHGVRIPEAFGPAMEVAETVRRAFAASPEPLCPCHNDLLAANFLLTSEGRLQLIDWEYAGMNDRFFDLGNFAVNNGLEDDEGLIAAYFGAVTARPLARLRLMRLISDLREAMWGLVLAGVSSLEVDFLAYSNEHMDRFLHNAGRSGFARLLEEAAEDA